MFRYGIIGLSAALLLAAPAAAQQGGGRDTVPGTIGQADLPADAAERLTAFFNDPETIHFSGRTRIPADRTVQGDVAVLGGPVTIAGRIEGRLVVINGDVELLPGAVITGDLTVAGGRVTGEDQARIGGEMVAYSQPLPLERRGDRIVLRGGEGRARAGITLHAGGGEGDDDGEAMRETGRHGRADFVVATGQSYNRVEGLPITFGPIIETSGANPLRIRAQAIYRTEEGLAVGPGRWGYDVRVEQFLGGERAFRVGASVRSVVDPIEAWHLTKLENGLATFFLHRDYRDHYQREGWSAYATLAPQGSPLSLTGEFRSESNESLPSGSPWTIFKNDDPWRAQPLVGEGRLKTASLTGAWDTRSGAEDPSTGWFVSGMLERSIDSRLTRPAAVVRTAGGPDLLIPAETFGDFTAGTVDVRRYNRISPNSRLNLRLLAGGALTGGRLPPQRQHALGGEGSLPGYGLFSLDCGARRTRVQRPGDVAAGDDRVPSFYTGYGCDRFALAQAEYRGNLSFHFDWSGDDDGDDAYVAAEDGEAETAAAPRRYHGRSWNADFGWVVFSDVGRAWQNGTGSDEETAVDLGLGVLLGKVGIYGAVPLNGDGRGLNVFVRLAPRF
ncbi:MAG TPA: hypothetical protein VFE05_09120 [Longimicrobiaceae bacterium]|jgi:hypothetical protein|nr:hypothetical protein [Longimicrobiaceae bacterium]